MKVLFVLTSHDRLGDTGRKTGFWLEEFAAPYYAFVDAGADVVLASPKGGAPPLDPKSDAPGAQTDATRRFRRDPDAQAALAQTRPLAEVSPQGFDALFYPGGHGPLWDLTNDRHSIGLIEAMAAAGKPVGAVCHAPAALLNAKGRDGRPWIQGKKVTGFSNAEEEAVQLTKVVPFLLQDVLLERGARYLGGAAWQPHVVTDGRLVTGQNPASSGPAAAALIALIRSA